MVTNDWNVVAKELGFHIKQKPTYEQKVIKCKDCGAPMVVIEGTNLVICRGTIEKEIVVDGAKKKISEPCKNYILRAELNH